MAAIPRQSARKTELDPDSDWPAAGRIAARLGRACPSGVASDTLLDHTTLHPFMFRRRLARRSGITTRVFG